MGKVIDLEFERQKRKKPSRRSTSDRVAKQSTYTLRNSIFFTVNLLRTTENPEDHLIACLINDFEKLSDEILEATTYSAYISEDDLNAFRKRFDELTLRFNNLVEQSS